jgi:outer membrane protein TolC
MGGFSKPPSLEQIMTPYRAITVSQGLPYPGKLTLRSKVAATEADAARWSYEDTRVRLIAELKVAYLDYILITRTLAIVGRSKTALEQYRGIAEARLAVGKASQQDVLRAGLELSILLGRIASLEQDQTMRRSDINRLLNRTQGTPVPVSDPVEIQPAASLEQLLAHAAVRYPGIKRNEQLINRGQQALTLAQKERLPDFGVSFTTQKYTGMPWMYGVDFMVTLPIYAQRKQLPMVAEAVASLESATRMRENALTDVAARVTQAHAALVTSQNLMNLYRDSVLPQARLALESSTADYEVGSVDFLTVITNFITVLDYEVNYEEQSARRRQALARLEALVGVEFIR